MIRDLHKPKRISSDFDTEIRAIKNKYSDAVYPIRFIRSITNNCSMPPEDDVSVIVPPNLFEKKNYLSSY